MSPHQIDDLTDLAPAAELRPLGQAPSGSGADPRLPGLLLTAVVVAAALGLKQLTGFSSLVIAVLAGTAAANLGLIPRSAQAGTRFAAKRLLRVGIVLLGLRLAIVDVLGLGVRGLTVVLAIVALTFLGTRWLGRRMGVSDGLSLMVATGFSICGASAVAAMDGVADAEEEEVAFAIGLVTLFGTIAMFALPLLRLPLGIDAQVFGQIAGASVHDVAQVIGTAATAGDTALQSAIVVKLTRVVTLAPMVALVGLAIRSSSRSIEMPDSGEAPARPPLLPLFVVGFLAAVVVRSSGLLSDGLLDVARTGETLLLTAAMFGLGVGVDIRKLRKLGGRPVLLAAISWLLILTASYIAFVVIGI